MQDHGSHPQSHPTRVLMNSSTGGACQALREGLDPTCFELAQVQPGPAFVKAMRDICPDVVILDRIHDRVEAVQMELAVVKDVRPEARVIVVSDHSCPEDVRIVEQGVFYYLTHDVETELVRVVRAAAQSLNPPANKEAIR